MRRIGKPGGSWFYPQLILLDHRSRLSHFTVTKTWRFIMKERKSDMLPQLLIVEFEHIDQSGLLQLGEYSSRAEQHLHHAPDG